MQGDKNYNKIVQSMLQECRKDAFIPGQKIRDVFFGRKYVEAESPRMCQPAKKRKMRDSYAKTQRHNKT